MPDDFVAFTHAAAKILELTGQTVPGSYNRLKRLAYDPG